MTTPDDWVRHVVDDVNSVVKRNCFINGKEVNLSARTPHNPQIFPISIHEDNAFGVKGGGSTVGTADGYWVFLEPMSHGDYTIEFEGLRIWEIECSVKYYLKILP